MWNILYKTSGCFLVPFGWTLWIAERPVPALAPMCRLKMYINCRRSNYREDCRNSKDDFHSWKDRRLTNLFGYPIRLNRGGKHRGRDCPIVPSGSTGRFCRMTCADDLGRVAGNFAGFVGFGRLLRVVSCCNLPPICPRVDNNRKNGFRYPGNR